MKNGTFVGDIVASEASRGTAYVSFDAHRDGDFAPYIFRTTDFGKTWTAVTTGLPKDDASVRSLAEYPGQPNVLFAGTERALFVTHDSGAHWTRLAANLPTTRYDDIVVHPRTKDLVLGTHGRGIWILDDASPIAEWTPAIAAKRGASVRRAARDADAVLGRRLEHGARLLRRRRTPRRARRSRTPSHSPRRKCGSSSPRQAGASCAS